jgi:glucuronokinase
MIQTARQVGPSAKFAGSGGAIVGVYRDDAEYDKLKTALAAINCTTFKPTIFA